MKNHSGRRSFLRFATSKRNRIISFCIIPLVLLLSFLGSSRIVFADSTYTNVSVTGSNFTWYANWSEPISTEFGYSTTYSPSSVLNKSIVNEAQYVDLRLVVQDKFDFASAALNKKCSGIFQSRASYKITAKCSNMQDVEIMFTGINADPADYDIVDLSTRTQSSFDSTNGRDLTVGMNILSYFADREFYTNTVYLTYILNFRIYFRGSGFISLGIPSISVTRTVNPNNVGSLRYTASTTDMLNNINDSINAGNASEVSAINSAASQAHSDAANLRDDLNYDHSGTSQTVSATQSAYDAAQGAADTAVDAAVHNYTSDLSTVEAYDYSSFFTSQRNSAVFWRDVGEYILDSSNLGFVSGSIIIVTLIGLVIFMLRL